MSEQERQDKYLALARKLAEQIEGDNSADAQATLDELTHIRETEMFRELGQLTRDLHEALKSFKVDTRLTDIAANDIPDARERLNHVINMTDQAAHRTLNAIEGSLPLVDEVGGKARYLKERWQQFRNRELGVDEFRMLSREVEQFLETAEGHGASLQASLSDALMAQDYQDLTGQIIRRVISLVQEVEDGLVELVRISGARMGDGKAEKRPEESAAAADNGQEGVDESDLKGRGPAVPGQDEGVVSGQDEVDDLLSSLGF